MNKGYQISMETIEIVFIAITIIAAPYIVWDAIQDRKPK
jgi:hypothetical protein